MTPALLDTNALSAILRGRASVMTRFEALRGLKAKGAAAQIRSFELFCAANEVLPLTDAIVVRAADIYADLHRRGQLIGDADTLIAATALEHGLDIVTNNVEHFGRVPGVILHDWLAP